MDKDVNIFIQEFKKGNEKVFNDIILLHKMCEDTEKQIIGRGFRIGMANNINIHHILHNNEI